MKKKKARHPFPHGRVVVDYETDGLTPYDGGRPFICGMEDEAGNVVKARVGHSDWKKAVAVIEDPKIEKIAHGSKFELKHSYHMGITPRGKFHDTMAKAVLVNEYQKINLDELSQNYLNDHSKGIVKEWLDGNAARIKRETGRDANYKDVPPKLLEDYLEGDLDKTLRLDWLWRRHVEDNFSGLYNMETDLAWDIAKMEDHGFHIDLPYVEKEIRRLSPEMVMIEKELNEMAGVAFNPASHQQLGDVMIGLGMNTGVTNKDGSMKTEFGLLTELDPNPFIDKLIRWRGLNKIVGTYLVPFTQMAVGDVVHGSLWQYGRDKAIVTGRLSSSDPNLQNIPGGGRSKNKVLIELGPIVRRAIKAPPGYSLLFFDYQQIEMVIFSCYAGDERILNDIKNGVDIYVAHGKHMLGENAFNGLDEKAFKRKRFEAKELCLSFIYGMGLTAFAKRVKLSMSDAKMRKNAYFANSPKTRDCMLKATGDLLSHGFVSDPFGRRYHVPKELAYKAINAKCQGAAATVAKKGVIRARTLASLGFKPINMIHDELLGIVPTKNLEEAARAGIDCMQDKDSFDIPIKVSASYSHTNWADKKELTL